MRKGIILEVATVAVDATLQVGVASQQIVVNADVPLLQTEDSAQHMDFDTQAVLDAPIVGGVWYNELTNELPGINGGGSQDHPVGTRGGLFAETRREERGCRAGAAPVGPRAGPGETFASRCG